MIIDLTEKSKELKEFVSQYESTLFLGDLSSLMQLIRFNSPLQTLKGLSSPQRQLLYLAGLNVSSDNPPYNKDRFSDDEFEHIKILLNEIESGYEQFFFPRPDDVIDEEWQYKRKVAMPTFLSYFNHGLLNYEEQIIERIQEYLTPFNTEIFNYYGLYIEDFLNIYEFIDKIPNEFLNNNINKRDGQQSWEEFCEVMKAQNIMPWEWNNHLPDHFQNFFGWMYDKGKMFRYHKSKLINEFGNEKVKLFLNIFTCKRQSTDFFIILK